MVRERTTRKRNTEAQDNLRLTKQSEKNAGGPRAHMHINHKTSEKNARGPRAHMNIAIERCPSRATQSSFCDIRARAISRLAGRLTRSR